jgi:hypothetical protein
MGPLEYVPVALFIDRLFDPAKSEICGMVGKLKLYPSSIAQKGARVVS